MPRMRFGTTIVCALAAGALACVPGSTWAQDVTETEVVLAALSNIWHDRAEPGPRVMMDADREVHVLPELGASARFASVLTGRFGGMVSNFCPADECSDEDPVHAEVMKVERGPRGTMTVTVMRIVEGLDLDIVEITLRLDERGEWSVVDFRVVGEG